ncbi:hypothetical protein JCM8097_000879 [Rhodosporidiobolus ruineniae]
MSKHTSKGTPEHTNSPPIASNEAEPQVDASTAPPTAAEPARSRASEQTGATDNDIATALAETHARSSETVAEVGAAGGDEVGEAGEGSDDAVKRTDETAALPSGAQTPPATTTAAPADPDTAASLAKQLASFAVSPSPADSASQPAQANSAPASVPPVEEEAEPEEEEWPLKEILWPPLPPTPSSPDASGGPARQDDGGFEVDPRLRVKIVMQNKNGPCSLIALCNVLILRNDLQLAPGRETVTYSYLASLLGDYFLRVSTSPSSTSAPTSLPEQLEQEPNLSLEAALEILPSTRYGLTLNPRFDRIDGFTHPSGSTSGKEAGELALFALARVPLLHGWLVSPSQSSSLPSSSASSPAEDAALDEWAVLGPPGAGDYDTALTWLVEGREIAGPLGFELDGVGEEELGREVERRVGWTEEEQAMVRRAATIDRFLSSTSTQLTYPGLFALTQSPLLPPSGLAALFRNSHLSVLYRRPSVPSSTPVSSPELFTLVTDSTFAHEPAVVWESLGDVDGSASEFWDARLRRVRARGDWVANAGPPGAGERDERERESARREREEGRELAEASGDLALAQHLQAEEDALSRDLAAHEDAQRFEAEHARRSAVAAAATPSRLSTQRDQQDALHREEARRGKKGAKGGGKKGEKEKCVVM